MANEKKNDEEYFKEQFETDLKNKKDEKARLEKAIAENDEILGELKEVADLMQKGMKVMTDYPKIIRPVFEFETRPEYEEYICRARELDMKRKFYALRDRDIPGMERDVNAKQEQLKILTEQINTMENGEQK